MKHLFTFLICSLMATAAMPQSREVFFEDFETGTFVTDVWANGWGLQQSTSGDYWIVGACADKVTPSLVSSTNKVAYITKAEGNNANAYAGANHNGRQAHFYRDVHLNADSIYVLTFDWKSQGSSNIHLKVSSSATSYTPSGGLSSDYASQIGTSFYGHGSEWQSASIPFTHTATEDRRLFFTWVSSGTVNNPPAAVDNIRLTAYPKENVQTVNVTAGSLKDQNGIKEATRLTVTGNLNASDFVFMRDSMHVLQTLDISGATVDEIPQNAFYNGFAGKIFLKEVILPTTAYSIGAAAFRECTGLTGTLNLAAATSIGNAAFFFTSSSASGKFDGVTFSDELTTIGDSAFYYAFYNATGNLDIPAKVTSIGENAFTYYAYNKNEAHELTFAAPSELTTIGASAFQSLRYFSGNLVIPAKVTTIGKSAFGSYGSTGMLSFASSSQLTTIGDNAFSSSKFTGNLTIPDGVTSIGAFAFSGCRGLNGTLTLPSALETIGGNAFNNCSALQFPDVTIPSAMMKIEDNTFYGCAKLISVTLHEGITAIGSNAFQNTGISSIDLKRVASIGSSAFSGCTALTAINIPQGVTAIANSTFEGCTSLSTVTLPASLEKVGTSTGGAAFKGCTKLDSITVLATAPPALNGTGNYTPFNGVTIGNVKLKVPTSATVAYKTAWGDFTNIVGGGYSVTAKSNINTLGIVAGIENKLYPPEIVNLTAVPKNGSDFINWTSGNTKIGTSEMLALNVQSDTAVTANFGTVLDHNLAVAGTLQSVANITDYTRITLNGNINAKDIAYMRDSLPDLKELFLAGASIVEGEGNAANTLPPNAFAGMKLVALTLPDNLVVIGKNALRECTDISNALTIPPGVTSIGAAAFYNCSRLTGNLTLPAKLTSIADSTFLGCSGLKGNVVIPAGITSVGTRAFQSCSGLSSLLLPRKLASIGSHAFRGCSGLTSVTALNPVPVTLIVTDGVWADLNSSCILYVANSSEEAYRNDPGWKVFTNIQGAGFSVSAEPNNVLLGTVTGLENRFYQANEPVTLIATPAENFFSVKWTSKEIEISLSETLNLVVTRDTAVVANFSNEYSDSVAAGQLHTVAGITKKSKLTLITGSTIDASDFAFMRDSMKYLIDLDILAASIVEYTGTDGTVTGNAEYAANKIPQQSFIDKKLVSVKLPANATRIGESAFRNTVALTKIEIPAVVTAIEDSAFSGSGITGITFAAGAQLTTIGDYAFSGCTDLAGSLTIPAKVSDIGAYAFAHSGIFEFSSSNKLTSVSFPDSLRTIGTGAFRYSSSLERIRLQEGLTSIGEQAFKQCRHLKGEVRIPTTMKSVAQYTFANDSIQYLELHDGITELGSWAFADNPFDSIRVYNTTPMVLDAGADPNPFNGATGVLLVPEGSYSAYLKAPVWSQFEFGSDNLMFEYGIDYGNRDWKITAEANDTDLGYVEDISKERGMPDWIRIDHDYPNDEYYYFAGQTATVKATPHEGNTFVKWTNKNDDETVLSTDREYSFEVTGKATLTAHFAVGTGINEISVAGDVRIYPNPATEGVLTVTSGNLHPGDKLSVYDVSGAFIAAYKATGNKTTLDVTRLSRGSYLLKTGTATVKFVVIR